MDRTTLMDKNSGFYLSGRMFELRRERVMLDRDVARLYEVELAALHRALKRGRDRFPPGSVFQITRAEFEGLRKRRKDFKRREHPAALPHAFTKLGVFMVSSVIKNKRADEISVALVREYVRARHQASGCAELEREIQSLEASGGEGVQAIFKVLAELRNAAGGNAPEPRKPGQSGP